MRPRRPTGRTGAEFTTWAKHHRLTTLPANPLTVACYIVELATVAKPSTIARCLVSIGEYHRAARLPSPTEDPEVEAVWAGIRHEHGTAADVAEPIGVDLLRSMIAKLPPAPEGSGTRRCSSWASPPPFDDRSSSLSTRPTSSRDVRAWWSTSDDPRATRRRWGGGWASPTARIQRRAQYAPSRTGAGPPASTRAPCSSPLTVGGASRRTASIRRPCPGSCGVR